MTKTVMKDNRRSSRFKAFLACLVLAAAFLYAASTLVSAAPTGATLENVSSSQRNSSDPDWGNHSRGAIHTIRLNADQQDLKWKAYIGNVSSNFVLDDQAGYSIYRWTITSFTGQVYVTRNDSINWGTVACATVGQKESEDTAIGHTSTVADSVNSTFPTRAHEAFTVNSVGIGQNSCFSTATYVNDTSQTPGPAALFQEVLLYDTTSSAMIYTTMVENDVAGYNNNPGLQNRTYDFQLIVPEHNTLSNPAFTYYFYIELTSS